MAERISESLPTAPSLEREATHLRERFAEHAQKPEQERAEQERAEVRTFAAEPPEEVLPRAEQMPAAEQEEIALALEPEEHDETMNELLGILQEKGIHAALSVAAKMESPHIEDDFHRFLVQYIKAGYAVPGLSERDRLWPVFHTTLFEVTLPDAQKEEARERPLKELLSSMEQFYAGMRSVADRERGKRAHFTLELATPAGSEEILLYAAVPDGKRDLFEKQVLALFPDAHIREETNDYNVFVTNGAVSGSIGALAERGVFPLTTYESFDHDPLHVILNALSKLKREEGAAIQLVCNPEGDYVSRFKRVIERIEAGEPVREATKFSNELLQESKEISRGIGKEAKEISKTLVRALTGMEGGEMKEEQRDKESGQQAIEQIRTKISTFVYATNMRIAVSAAEGERADALRGEIEAAFNQFESTHGNRFSFLHPKRGEYRDFIKAFSFRQFERPYTMPLSTRELTSFMHFPVSKVSAPQFKQSKAASAPAPTGLPQEGVLIGTNTYRGVQTEAHLTPDDRLRHFYVVGQTGTGKTTLLKNMIAQDIEAGEGVCMIDPHGPDVEEVLGMVPEERMDDVIYFDPSDTEHVLALNMMEFDPAHPEQKTFVVNELFNIFRKLYGSVPESMGPMFEQYFRNAALLVLEDPESGATLLDVSRVLADEEYRSLKLSRAQNPVVKQFWERIAEQAGGEQSLANIVPYITSKFDTFTANDYLRPIIAQEKSALDMGRIMDEKKILLVNLSKGKLGDINANLLGLIIVGKILMAALARTGDRAQLPPFYLFIDEFQNVTTDSIETILSEARKYKLSLTMAHQFIAQLEEGIRDSVFGNVGSLAAFRVGSDDAEFLEQQFSPVFTAHDLMNIENRNAYVKLLANGQPVKPFDVAINPPRETNKERAEQIKQASKQKYGRPRATVEASIQEKYRGLL